MWATGRELGLKGQGSREVRLASAQSWGPLVLGHILVYQGYMYVSRERNPFFFSPNPCKSSNLQEQRGEGVPPPPEPRWPISFHRRNPIIALRSPTLPRHSQSTKLQVNLSSEAPTYAHSPGLSFPGACKGPENIHSLGLATLGHQIEWSLVPGCTGGLGCEPRVSAACLVLKNVTEILSTRQHTGCHILLPRRAGLWDPS